MLSRCSAIRSAFPCVLLLLGLGGALVAPDSGNTAAQQPQSGIDPCSRAMALMATPVVPGELDPAENRLAVSQVVMNFTSCFNRRAWDGVLAMTSQGFRASMFGVSDADELRSRFEELDQRGLLPQLRIQSIEENGTTGSTLATLVVTWRGWNGLHKELWRLQVENGHWVLAGRSIQTPQVGGIAVGIRFVIDVDGLRSPAGNIANPGTVVLAFENQRSTTVRILVLRVDDASSVDDVVTACSGTAAFGYRPVGELQVPANEIVAMPLFDLTDGRYAVVLDNALCTSGSDVSRMQVAMVGIAAVDETSE